MARTPITSKPGQSQLRTTSAELAIRKRALSEGSFDTLRRADCATLPDRLVTPRRAEKRTRLKSQLARSRIERDATRSPYPNGCCMAGEVNKLFPRKTATAELTCRCGSVLFIYRNTVPQTNKSCATYRVSVADQWFPNGKGANFGHS